MRAIITLAFLAVAAVAFGDTFGSGANTFDIEFVPIGNPGNPPDTTGSPNPAGFVPYTYSIGKYEVPALAIARANNVGGLGITPSSRGGLFPATDLSWTEAARFVNWLNESKGFHPAYKFAIQPGEVGYDPKSHLQLWVPDDEGYNPDNLYRNGLAVYFLPSIDEWYKAAYYDPVNGVYYDYPTGSDTPPAWTAGGIAPNTAVYYYPASGIQSPTLVTMAGGLSPYGTMGQGGNVFEMEETEWDLADDNPAASRDVRGGDFRNLASVMSSSDRGTGDQNNYTGFRVATSGTAEPPHISPPGDFNFDFTVDAGDYVVWRGNVGNVVPLCTGGDANCNGFVENAEY